LHRTPTPKRPSSGVSHDYQSSTSTVRTRAHREVLSIRGVGKKECYAIIPLLGRASARRTPQFLRGKSAVVAALYEARRRHVVDQFLTDANATHGHRPCAARKLRSP